MMNQKYILHSVAVLAVAALATACSSVDELTDTTSGVKETMTITAYQPNTRVGFDSNGDGYWQAGDKIGVWSNGENGESKSSPFTIATGAGEATATFSGTVTGGIGQYAVYPYNESHSLSDNTLTYSLPSSYTYTSVDQTFLPSEKNGNSFCMPMYGVVSDNKVQFMHLGGVICLKIDKMPAESGTVKVTDASNRLCGTFTANLTDTNPEIKTATSDADTDKSVTFTYSGATADKPGVFYLPVASGCYNLSVLVADGEKYSYTTDYSVTVARSELQALKVVTKYAYNVRTVGGHKFVDLGLPSGLLWAETNIGVETAYDDGNYYAWGETEPKDSYSWDTYRWGTAEDDILKYNDADELYTLELEDDAAYVNWGSGCRMPTQSEFYELSNTDNCTWTRVSCINSADETIDCYKVVSVKNGNIIYLPASGERDGDYLYDRDYAIYYWSSTFPLMDVKSAYRLYGSFYPEVGSISRRYYGFPVRAVAGPLYDGSATINDAVWNK